MLHAGGCGERMVRPLAVVCWPGNWLEDASERALKWHEVGGPACRPGGISQGALAHTATLHPAHRTACTSLSLLLPPPLQPTYAYIMPAYKRGSVNKLLQDVCAR